MENVLTVDRMTKVYRNGRGARNISFTLEKGQVLGLLGPNGSGKTTIMKVITGLAEPTDGEVSVFGANVAEQRETALAKVGALIEQPALFENLSAWDNLKLAAAYYPDVDNARMEEVLHIVGLSAYKKEKCGRFSLGMKQRMGLALAILSRPELVVLDEPTNGLDIEATIGVREVINHLSTTEGTTFLVASHLASEIEKICTHVLVLHEGDMVCWDSKEDALRLHPSLEDYFLEKVRDKKGFGVL